MKKSQRVGLPPLIRALLAPDRYGSDVADVSLVQTDRSWVLLAGSFAYKIKKPVEWPLPELCTLAQRKRSCEEELRLNQRLSPDLYLAVLGIFHSPEDPQWQGDGQPIEYALKMRRFDQDARLDHVCEQGELLPGHLSDLAHTVVAFHQAAAVAPAQSPWGADAGMLEQVQRHVADLLQRLPDRKIQARLHALQTWTALQHLLLEPLMQERRKAGCVRECHGDLQLENLVLMGGRVRLFGCIAFREESRWVDVVSELATTYVDLLSRCRPGLACWFVNEALARSGDYGSAPLLRFYAVHQALSRACASFAREGLTGGLQDEALACLALAENLVANHSLQLRISHGEQRIGATDFLLQEDAQSLTLRLCIDVERSRLFEKVSSQPGEPGPGASLYAADLTERTYTHVLALAETLLQADWSVLVVGPFSRRSQRERFRSLARSTGARFGILVLEASAQQPPSVEPLAEDEPVWPITERSSA